MTYKVKVIISTMDGEVLDQMVVSPNQHSKVPAPVNVVQLSNHVREVIAFRFEVEEW